MFFTCFFLLSFCLITQGDESLVRKTNNGLIEGITSDNVNLWLGVPFAEPPLNFLRFKRPVAKTNWTGILKTATNPKRCMQFGINNEDCLYLNIIAPKNSSNLPVLVWIHGGGFVSGGASDMQETFKKFSAKTNIIVVSLQYRLGLFGFLYMGTDNAPGNMGLLDQALAIKWVYENIPYFSGDNSRITIAGQSAGGKSTGFQLLSKLSSNYYSNAIMMSGSGNADTIITKQDEAILRNTNFLKLLKCNGSAFDLVNCSLKMNSSYLFAKSNEYRDSLSKEFFISPNPLFTAVVDKYFLTDEPRNLLKNGDFKKCSVITGSVKNEGLSFFSNWFQFKYFPAYPQLIKKEEKLQINAMYPYEGSEAGGDFSYLCPSNLLAHYYALNGLNVYNYYYTNNCCHGSELAYFFGGLNKKDDKQIFSDKLVKYWSSFIYYNNPNVNSSFNWPLYDSNKKAYIDLNKNKFSVKYDLKNKECSLWEKLYGDASNNTAKITLL